MHTLGGEFFMGEVYHAIERTQTHGERGMLLRINKRVLNPCRLGMDVIGRFNKA